MAILVIKRPSSQITFSPEKAAALVKNLRQTLDDQTARLGSDTVGILAGADPDQRFFITAPFKDMRLVQHGNGNQVTNSLALMPPDQNGTLEDRYYKNGTPVILDKAGSGAGTSQLNLIRTGQTPDGYYGGDKVMVQTRHKIYTIDEDHPDFFVYSITVRSEPRGYVLQPDERYDGGFYPGRLFFGRTYGTTFPTNDQGHYLYNDNPDSDAGWSGATYAVPEDAATKPVITSASPSSFTLPAPVEGVTITLTGSHFTGCGFFMVGPYLPDIIPGVGLYLFIDDSTARILMPLGIKPGSYDIYVTGVDGQLGVCPTPFVVS